MRRPPSYVIEVRRLMGRMEKAQRKAILDHFPADSESRALLGYFRSRLRIEKSFLKRTGLRPKDAAWHARYSPKSYVSTLEYEARLRLYSFFVMALRTHAAAFARRPNRKAPADSKARYAEQTGLRHAMGVLDAIGGWWIGSKKGPVRPYVTKAQRRALETCAGIHRLLAKSMEQIHEDGFMRKFGAYLER